MNKLKSLMKFGSKYASKVWKATKALFTSGRQAKRGAWFWRAVDVASLASLTWDALDDDNDEDQIAAQKVVTDCILNIPVLSLLHNPALSDAEAVRYAYTSSGVQMLGLPGDVDNMRAMSLIIAAKYHHETRECQRYLHTLKELGKSAEDVANMIDPQKSGIGTVFAGAAGGGEQFTSLEAIIEDMAEDGEVDPVIYRNLDFLVYFFEEFTEVSGSFIINTEGE